MAHLTARRPTAARTRPNARIGEPERLWRHCPQLGVGQFEFDSARGGQSEQRLLELDQLQRNCERGPPQQTAGGDSGLGSAQPRPERAGPDGKGLTPLPVGYHERRLCGGAELIGQPCEQPQHRPLTADMRVVKALQRQPAPELG
jgi:hypothetical protein